MQLHGTEPAEFAKHIPVPVIKVFHVSASEEGLKEITRPGLNRFVLLDAVPTGSQNGLSGGTGTKMDWEVARAVVERGEGNAVSVEFNLLYRVRFTKLFFFNFIFLSLLFFQ